MELVKLIAGKRIDVEIDYESIYGEKKHLVANTKVFSRSLDEAYQKLVQRW
ncbi:hypothetical protein [Variovorax sp. PAMC 28711]|uniref:hypothetical protein n=1 Tax=Variovorax sp. PAMC 28711 TaxID=1795631 RepID=UPI0012E7D345|nr:hypothetical protein [Variovorax sp. PAMC 28711]